MGQGLEALNEDTTSFTGCCLTSWTGGDNWAGAGLVPQEVTEEGWRGVQVKALKTGRLTTAHDQAVNFVPLLLLPLLTSSLLFDILEGAKSPWQPAAGTEEEPIDAGAQDSSLLLVALVVEHAHARVRLAANSTFSRLDFELCRDGPL